MSTAPEQRRHQGEICLTFDVEERFHSHLSAAEQRREWRMRDRIAQIIDWLEEHGKTATCFVVGELAEQYPDLIVRMVRAGCEVASHSHGHLWMAADDAPRCKEDITRSKKVLEDISGEPVYGYRSPSWSAHRSDEWLWDHLAELGFLYDSSLFPIGTHMYGSWRNPPDPYWLNDALLEIPPTVHMLGRMRIPYGGGFYFRLYPSQFTAKLLQRDNRRGKIPIFYFHPWDFEADMDAMEDRWSNRLIANWNLKTAWDKFARMVGALGTCRVLDRCRDLTGAAH